MKNSIYDKIRNEAIGKGACSLADGMGSMEELARTFFKPQGREFCIEHGFPTLDTFRELKHKGCAEQGVHVDSKVIAVSGMCKCAFVGDTQAAYWASGTEERHLVVLMHGASVTLHLSKGAVVRVERMPECEVRIIKEDKEGGIVLW